VFLVKTKSFKAHLSCKFISSTQAAGDYKDYFEIFPSTLRLEELVDGIENEPFIDVKKPNQTYLSFHCRDGTVIYCYTVFVVFFPGPKTSQKLGHHML